MKLADIAESISIDPRKLTHYALDPDSPHGRHKAVLLERLLGFTKENHTVLLSQLESGAMQAEVTFHSEDRFGKRACFISQLTLFFVKVAGRHANTKKSVNYFLADMKDAGKRYTADIPVEGTESRHAVVRTGWIIPPGSREAHLATLYVRKKK